MPRQEWDSPEALEQHVRSGPKKIGVIESCLDLLNRCV